ncbi:MAG: hypothetical protein E3J72_04620 [Planctomycetota bacterium]|nr:MAG: hypothetical protein E3J72_04620 [Planctomycetota bacterium]
MKPEEQINQIVEEEYLPLTREIIAAHSQMRAETAIKRNELREMYRKLNSREDALAKQRRAVMQRILEIWEKHFDEKKSIDLPIGEIRRCNKAKFEILDIAAMFDALDRADRLDLVTYTFDEKEVKKLFRAGKLEGLPEDAVKLENYHELQVRSKERLYGKKKA